MRMYDWDQSLDFQVQARQGADYQEEFLSGALGREATSESLQCNTFSLTGYFAFSKNRMQIKCMDSKRADPLIREIN